VGADAVDDVVGVDDLDDNRCTVARFDLEVASVGGNAHQRRTVSASKWECMVEPFTNTRTHRDAFAPRMS